jgi:type VI secretion system secreted protein VgrG
VIHQAHLTLSGLEGAAVVRVVGREAMNELTSFVVDVRTPDATLDPATLVDANAILSFMDATGGVTHFHLLVRDASHEGSFRKEEIYRVNLVPLAARLGFRVNHQVFQDKTSQEIIAELLQQGGFPSSGIKWRLAGKYAKRTYTVQYGESDWAFITRLCSDEGINYWFDRHGDDPLLVFGDAPSSHDSIDAKSPAIVYEDHSNMTGGAFAIRDLRRSFSIVSTKASLRDVDVDKPQTPVDGTAGEGALEMFEYPSNLTVPDAASARAKVRLEQLQRHRSVLSGKSSNATLRSGRVVEIVGAADDCFSGKFLITAVEHELEQDAQAGGHGVPYRNRVTLVPFDDKVPHRPAAPTTRPIVEGIENAIVTGPGGDEIHVDSLGRVKVRFFWDRSGIKDDKSSRWVRTLQMNLVAPQMLPRIGWEVPIVYENGDPDRPFVLGRAYNGGAPPPYGMPGKMATSTMQSGTSPSNGTTQELRMGDTAGSEETFVHATKDQTVQVGGSNKSTVSANRTDDVKKSQALTVHASQSTSVGGNQKVAVGADGIIIVKGARSETVAGNETIGVTGTYGLNVKGAYSELVGGLYSLRCNQANTTIQGAFTQVVGAALATTAGLGTHQSVAGARTEAVGGARSFAAAASYSDGTTGLKRISAGAANESANANVAFTAGARMQLQAGAAMSIEGGGKVVFEAPTISVKAATLTATGGTTMKLAGGLDASSTVKADAPVAKKTKKVEVEG